jgi:hypothetical protein
MSLEWARQFPEDVAVMEAFYAEKEEAKFAIKAAKQAARKEREEKAARRAEEKKNGAGPSTINRIERAANDFYSQILEPLLEMLLDD